MPQTQQKDDEAATMAQAEAFKKTALALGVDESDDALDRVMGKLDLKRKPEVEKPAKK